MKTVSRSPSISLVLPVHNGASTLDAAVRSVRAQTFADWELLAVDDASTDGTFEALRAWVAQDSRIRVVRLDENRGPSAARNAGLRCARGDFVAYLDDDDEYYPDYLDQVARYRDQGDVLVFRYELVYDDGLPQGPTTWDPLSMRDNLFTRNISVPLGVAHLRELWEKVGGFNELLLGEEDWEFWKRLARAGAEFIFLPLKSGCYHVRQGSVSRERRLTRRQQETLLANWQARRPIYGDRPLGTAARKVEKILFASWHCQVDFTSGAAIATLQALRFLKQQGFQCRVFCGSQLDAREEVFGERLLARWHMPSEIQSAWIGDYHAQMLSTSQGGVPISVFQMPSTRSPQVDNAETVAFYKAYAAQLDGDRPDIVLTYGGDPFSQTLIDLAKNRDIPVVFCLHNFLYKNPASFASVDYVTVPSEFSRQYHWAELGLACHTLPNIIDWQRVQVADRKPRYVTFVNPQPTKGVYVFARIAEQLARRRPDIPILVVEGRGKTSGLQETGIDVNRAGNLTTMPATHDPREFYAVTKLLLMPSLWNESFGLVAIEAMLNGIPVLGSNRGALPETISQGGFLFDIPACYTPQTQTVPTAEEVHPWVETIIRLWDDDTFYRQSSEGALANAERFRPVRLAPLYLDFFSNIFPQPGPPIVPMEWRLP